jgi:6-pyruvoyltetrahydropterin/6-carboxytetrahydropterin synthase
MHKLNREVRFSINPFTQNARAEGLSLDFGLWVELSGQVDPPTGFIVNIVEVDKAVHKYVTPMLERTLKEHLKNNKDFLLSDIVELLKKAWRELQDKFTPARLSGLSLELNPFRKIAVDSEDCKVVYFSEKFEFSAGHKLWNEEFSEERNFELFGKCANPAGHGHNYTIEITVKGPSERSGCGAGEFEKTIEEEFIRLVDHKNLNTDVPGFENINPTVENIAVFAWNKLAGRFGDRQLHCVTIRETDKTYCSYYGSDS